MSSSARPRPIKGEFRYRHPIEIRYGDTDALGHVNNAVYLSYFEMARSGYYTAVEGHPFGTGPDAARRTFVIAEAHIAYRAPALFGEALACWCRVGWAGRSSFGLEYRIEVDDPARGELRLIADGSTVQVFYDLHAGKIMRLPADLLASMTTFESRELRGRPAGS